jgi:putative Mg2+ transporter-C (MgtC) family protein
MAWLNAIPLLDQQMMVRLLVSAVLGSIIGADRERISWAAGLRTHMLVCVGACLLMIVSAFGFSDILGTPHVILDPSRIAAQVVSGIGFLGAGTILLRGEIVRGLTTAASLWAVAAIGLAVGSGLYLESVAATVLILAILAGIKPLEERLQRRHMTHEFIIAADNGEISIGALEAALGYRARRITRYIAHPGGTEGVENITITLKGLAPRDIAEIEQELLRLKGVRQVERP